MEEIEEMLSSAVSETTGSSCLDYDGERVDFKTPFRRYRLADLVKEHSGIDLDKASDFDSLRDAMSGRKYISGQERTTETLFYKLILNEIEPVLGHDPVFVYDAKNDKAIMGIKGDGPVILAVDNLPCELPKESSKEFSAVLKKFIPAIARADFNVEFSKLDLPPEIKKAVIAYKGKLTPDYKYLEKHIK